MHPYNLNCLNLSTEIIPNKTTVQKHSIIKTDNEIFGVSSHIKLPCLTLGKSGTFTNTHLLPHITTKANFFFRSSLNGSFPSLHSAYTKLESYFFKMVLSNYLLVAFLASIFLFPQRSQSYTLCGTNTITRFWDGP